MGEMELNETAEDADTVESSIDQDPALAAANEHDADILLINAPIGQGLSDSVRAIAAEKGALRENVVVILVTGGGVADDAYRAAVALRSLYSKVTVCVSGWCKSAGTLLAIGADELIFGCNGEMGPLDVQIAKKDELVENRDSGLVLGASINSLTESAFGVFEKFMTSIIERSQGAITFRTAAHIAADVAIGVMSPVFEKIDPLRMGADQRAQQIGLHYAWRLDRKADNLRGIEALNMLLNGYPSHSFVIDMEEASGLFTRVKPLAGYLEQIVERLGELARFPRGEGLVCYLDGDGNGKSHHENEPSQGEGDGDSGDSDEQGNADAEEL